MHRCARAGGPFDEAWMQRTFDEFWAYAQWPTRLTNTLIDDDIPMHIVQLLGRAAELPEIAQRFVHAFTAPQDLADWFFAPDKAFAYLDLVEQRRAAFRAAAAGLATV
jgi:hypothetical protein